MEEKHTLEGLPIVTSAQYDAYRANQREWGRDIETGSAAEHPSTSQLREIAEENPLIAQYILDNLHQIKDPTAKMYACMDMLGVYFLLKNQAQANKMDEQ